MAKSGFVPAWMKIQSSDKTNVNQKLSIDRSNSNTRQSQTVNRSETISTSSSPSIVTGRQRHHSSDIIDHTTTRHSPFYYYKTIGQHRNRSNDQQILNDVDGQSENIFSFSSSYSKSRRSYSRERLSDASAKNSEFNDNNKSFNGYRSINNSQRRLHSISSYPNDRQLSNTHHNSTNGNSDRSLNYINDDDHERTYGNNDQTLDLTISPNDDEQINHPSGFDRHEQDFPSLNGHEKNKSSVDDQSSSIWKNAATKLRSSHNETFKLLDRSLSNHSNNARLFGSTRILSRKDRLLSTPNGINGTTSSSSSITNTNRSATLDLQTNCITQTKNLDKRSDFFNSLKNDSTNERNKNGNRRQYNESSKPVNNSDKKHKTSRGTLLLLSVPETPEEKELLTRMGWKEGDELTYEITDEDKEEYEKRIQLSPKSDNNTSAALMSALNRRALPCIDIRDVLRCEMFGSTSDDDSSDD